jgi:hypothetical protein
VNYHQQDERGETTAPVPDAALAELIRDALPTDTDIDFLYAHAVSKWIKTLAEWRHMLAQLDDD